MIISEESASSPSAWCDGSATAALVVRDHPLPAVLRKPDAWQTRLEFIKMMQVSIAQCTSC
jgi:phage portal protein BeeE